MNASSIKKEVACKHYMRAKENLPYPIVLYPGFYGAFFAFRKQEHSRVTFCSCSKEAISNYINIQISKKDSLGWDPTDGHKKFFIDFRRFPQEFIDELKRKKVTEDLTILRHFAFENKICHECNRVVPRFRYCKEMYGGAFKQNYGWYINKQAYEWGVDPPHLDAQVDLCPQEISELLELKPYETLLKIKTFENRGNIEKASEMKNKLDKQKRKIWNIIENEVRLKFGFKKIGEAWTSETILYYIIQSLFPNKTILRHYRPEFLKGLELDIFIEELNIAVEYQGIQHYQPVKHWGGQETFEKLKERDNKKKTTCSSLGIPIIYFNYNEELSNNYVLSKIKKRTDDL